jgi:hypothetical protein
MRKIKSKLTLNATAVHVLANPELQRVGGGWIKTDANGPCSYDADTRYTFYANCTVDSYAGSCDCP